MATEKATPSHTQLFDRRDDVPASPMSKSKRAQKIAAARSRRRIHSSHYSQGYGSVKNLKKDPPSGVNSGHLVSNTKPVQNVSHVDWPDEDNERIPAPKQPSRFPGNTPGKPAPLQPISKTNPKALETNSSSPEKHGIKATSGQTFIRNQKRMDENTNPSRDESPILHWPIGDDSPNYKKAPSTNEILDASLKRSLDDASTVLEEERNSSITTSSSSLSSAELSNIARKALLRASEKSTNTKPSIERLKRTKAAARQRDDDDNQSMVSTSSRRSRYEKLSAAKKRTASARRKYEQNHVSRSSANLKKDHDRAYSEHSQRQNDIDDKQLTKTVQSIIANALENPNAEIFSEERGGAQYSTKSLNDPPADLRLQSSRSKATMPRSKTRTSEVERDDINARTSKSIHLEEGKMNKKELYVKTNDKILLQTNRNEEDENNFNTTSAREIPNGETSTADRLSSHIESFKNGIESRKDLINAQLSRSGESAEREPKNSSSGDFQSTEGSRTSNDDKALQSKTEIKHSDPAPGKPLGSKNPYLEHLQKQKNHRSKHHGGEMKRLNAGSSLSSSGSSSSADESMQENSKMRSVMGRIDQRIDFVRRDDSSGEGSEKRGVLSGEEITDEDESIRGVELVPSHASLSQADEAAFDGQFVPSKLLQTREEFGKKGTISREEIVDDGNSSMIYSSADESSFRGTGMQYSSTDESTLRGTKFLSTSAPSSRADESALVGQIIPTKEQDVNDRNNNVHNRRKDERKDDKFFSSPKSLTRSACRRETNAKDQFDENLNRNDARDNKTKDMGLEEDNDGFGTEFETSSLSQASDALEFWERKYAFNQDDDVNRIIKKALSPSAVSNKNKTQLDDMELFDGTKEKSQLDSTRDTKPLQATSKQVTKLESQIGVHPWPQQEGANQGSDLAGDKKKSDTGSDDDSQFSGSLFSGLDESTFRSIEFAKASKPFQGRDPLALTSKSKQPFDVFPQAPPPPPPPPPLPRASQGQEHCGEVLDESELLATVNSDITSSVLAGEGTNNVAERTKRSSFVIKEEASDDFTSENDPKSLSSNNMTINSQRSNTKPLSSDQSQKSYNEKSSINNEISGDNHVRSSHSQESVDEEEAEGFGAIFINILDTFSTFCRSPEPNADGKSQSPVRKNDVAEIQSVNTATGSVMSASQATMNGKEAKKWDDWDRRDSHAPTFADGSTMFTNGSATFTDGDGTFTDVGNRFADGETTLTEGEKRLTDGETMYTDGESKFTIENELTKRKAEAHEKLLHYRKGALMESAKDKSSKKQDGAPCTSSSSPSPCSSSSPSPSSNSSISESSEAGLNTLLDVSKAPKIQNLLTEEPLKAVSRSANRPLIQSNASVFSLNQRRIFEKFCKSLRSQGVEVLKQNRDGKWQVRYLTFSKEETAVRHVKLSHNDKDRGHCPTALLWVKRFNANKDHGISLIDKQGRGGVILANIVKVAATGLNESKSLLPKKHQAKYGKSVVVVVEYNLNGSVRSMALRCKNTNEAHFLCTGLRVCMDVLQREREGRKAVAAN